MHRRAQEDGAAVDEQVYVHNVYQDIAQHFSDTRYKPWSLVARFLEHIPPGSIGIDAGCGNGKYLGVSSVIPASTSRGDSKSLATRASSPKFIIGFDRSSHLVEIARSRAHEVFVSDCLNQPWRPQDYAISIATIHHFSTLRRRIAAVQALILSVSKDSGRILIQVWALEQADERALTRRKKLEPAQFVNERNSEQDVLVPWTLQSKPTSTKKESSTGACGRQDRNYEESTSEDILSSRKRYYHLFRKGELEELILQSAAELGFKERSGDGENSISINSSGWERGNWWAEVGLGEATNALSE